MLTNSFNLFGSSTQEKAKQQKNAPMIRAQNTTQSTIDITTIQTPLLHQETKPRNSGSKLRVSKSSTDLWKGLRDKVEKYDKHPSSENLAKLLVAPSNILTRNNGS